MVVKKVSTYSLFSVRDAGKGFILSLKASNRYAPSYLEALEAALAFLARYAEAQEWPAVALLSTAHLEEYLAYLQGRPRWFGTKDTKGKPVSQSYIETQYRRLRRFFRWMVSRGHIDKDPFDLIPHPHVDQLTIPTVPQDEAGDLLRILDPGLARNPTERYRMLRNRALLFMLWDTPARRSEITSMTIDGLDMDAGLVQVMGKGRKERWMPLGAKTTEVLWEYLVVRNARIPDNVRALWVSSDAKPLKPVGVYYMLKALGRRVGDPDLHTHRFRHSFTMNALRAGMKEPLLRLIGGWKKIPETYLRTLAVEDAAQVLRDISPADRLAEALDGHQDMRPGPARGRL